MAGHSKWATTKHRKAAQDKKRAALFSKLARNIYVAAKAGGDPNPENNASLAAAVAKAKSYSLPKDKIEAAIAKAFSSTDGADFEEIVYEGYGPAGVPIYVEALTDNRNRTAADIRKVFSRSGGNLGPSGSVAFQFERKGQIVIDRLDFDEDDLLLSVADAGGQDLVRGNGQWLVMTAAADLMPVKRALEAGGVAVTGAELVMEPVVEVAVSVADAHKVLRLVDALEELDDVQNVFHAMEFTDEIAATLE